MLITPILSFDDDRLQGTATPVTAAELVVDMRQDKLWLEAIKSVMPKPLDWIILEICERLGYQWPNWMDQISDAYDGEPPHTKEFWGI